MITEQEFEAIKQDFFDKNQQYVEAIRNLTVRDLQRAGTKGRITTLEIAAINSNRVLAKEILGVPMRVD